MLPDGVLAAGTAGVDVDAAGVGSDGSATGGGAGMPSADCVAPGSSGGCDGLQAAINAASINPATLEIPWLIPIPLSWYWS